MRTTFLATFILLSSACLPASAESAQSANTTAAGQCVVQTHNPHAAAQPHSPKADAPDVLSTLEKIVKAYSNGDLVGYEALLDDDCSYYDPEHDKMIVGKANVVEYLRQTYSKHGANGSQPLLSYTIDQPYVKVLGHRAVVTYRAFQEIGGKSPMHAEGLITKIFIKQGDGWKQQYDSSSWHAK